MFVIIGWVLALGCIFGVFIAHDGNIHVILHALPFEMITPPMPLSRISFLSSVFLCGCMSL